MRIPLAQRDRSRQIAFAGFQQEGRTTIEFLQTIPPPFVRRSITLVNEGGGRASMLDGLYEDVEVIILGPLC
jgi:hypothetical protein